MNHRTVLIAGLVFGMAAGAMAQEAKGVQGDLVDQIKSAERKFLALAETMSQEQYGWRPMEGVRSVGEVYVHVAISNIAFLEMIGIQTSLKVDWGMEKTVTKKAEIIEMLKKTFQIAKDAVGDVSDKDLDKTVKMFGREATLRSGLVLLATHAHEHLGQSIAYARTNKVVPPWTEGGM